MPKNSIAFVSRGGAARIGRFAEQFWGGYEAILRDLAPRNKALLDRRDEIQREIDGYHVAHKGKPFDMADYTAFLKRIGYILPEPANFEIATDQRRRRDRDNRRSAACRADVERALFAQCGECTLGQPL